MLHHALSVLLRGTASAALLFAILLPATAADKRKAITSIQAAGEDYAMQGEYAGGVSLENGTQDFGAQVIALGDGKFEVVGYTGGLPGDGWQRGDEVTRIKTQLVDGQLRFQHKKAEIVVDGQEMRIIRDDNVLGRLKKVDRKSPTLGAEPPAGAVVLFDGRDAQHFKNGKLVEGKWLAASGCESKQKFGDHRLHIEFRTPFMPHARGQARGNSGVYVQSRYEVQVLDSFGLEGKDNECGGIYKVSPPEVNMCLPPLQWQTYDIDFQAARYNDAGEKTQNARITVRHNGVLIHENRELPAATPGRHKEGPEGDALFLQDHGNPVVFRNIWVVPQ